MLKAVARQVTILIVLGAVSAAPLGAESLTPQQREEIGALAKQAVSPDVAASEQGIEALKAYGEAILGLSLEEVGRIPEFGRGTPPEKGTTAWHLWFDDACRRIEAYNAMLSDSMGAGEAENIRTVNTYREMLGILPLEADARLLQPPVVNSPRA